ncbi:hypothetical protein TrLO_g2959, partial [Triparma laevis f. longispina]
PPPPPPPLPQKQQQGGFAPRPRGVCYDWQKGICQRGMSCRFAHSDQAGGDPNQGAPMDPNAQMGGLGGGDQYQNFGGQQGGGNNYGRSRGVCYDWQKGICQRGDGC